MRRSRVFHSQRGGSQSSPATIILAGDSAGAHIASQVALITADPAYASAAGTSPQLKANQLSAMFLVSGAYDPSSVSFEGNEGGFSKRCPWAYWGTRNFREDERFRQMSVPDHVTAKFPQSFISSGNGDPLAPQTVHDPPPLALTKQTDSSFVDTLPVTFDRCLDARDSSKKAGL
jgi:acetyl esterase